MSNFLQGLLLLVIFFALPIMGSEDFMNNLLEWLDVYPQGSLTETK